MHVFTLTLRALSRWLLRAAGVLLLLATLLWAGLRWGIVPHVDHFRPQVERLAARLLDAEVHADSLAAEAGGLGFAFTVRGLQIRGTGGTQLQVRRLRALFSVPSLLRGQLRQLVIDAPQLSTRRPLAALPTPQRSRHPRRSVAARAALAWLLAQPEIAVRDGSLHWAAPRQPVLAVHAVDLYYHGGLLRRALRVAARPDGAAAGAWRLAGRWRRVWIPQAAGAGHPGAWSGRGYVSAPDIDGPRWDTLAQALGAPATPRWLDGAAAARAWLSWSDGRLNAVTGDVALNPSTLSLASDAAPVALPALRSGLQWRRSDTGWHAATHDLRPASAADAPLALGNRWRLDAEAAHGPTVYTLAADAIDLSWLAAVLQPALPARTQALLTAARPQGSLSRMRARWQGSIEAPRDWRLSGRVADLATQAIAHAPAANGDEEPGIPGLRGAAIDWQVDAAGGQATLAIRNGAARFPGIFAEPEIPVQQLDASVRWQQRDGALRVDIPTLRLANADAAGTFSGRWDSSATAGDPGTLDLRGTLQRGKGARVWRYLPLSVPADARSYVQHAITQGDIHDASVRVQGPLRDFPFDQPGSHGTFRISGQVRNARLAYVPRMLQPAGEPPWPALTQLQGTLTFAGAGMQIRGASANAENTPGWSFPAIRADIADLDEPRVIVDAQGQGQLGAALAIVRGSPIAALIDHALDDARASGTAHLQLKLDLPVDTMEHARVDGQVQLHGNALRFQPDGIELENARGGVHFDEHGFAIQDAQADFLGGSAQVSGGSVAGAAPGEASVRIQAHGSASAAGLRAMQHWGPVPALARAWQGEATYEATIAFAGAEPQIDVRSDLRGLASELPAPLAKPADAVWPLHYASSDKGWRLRVGQVLALAFTHARAGAAPRGRIVVGRAAEPTITVPVSGVDLRIAADRLNVGDWLDALGLDTPDAGADTGTATTATPAENAYLPTQWQISTDLLEVAGHRFHAFRGTATRSGKEWNATIDAAEAAGRVRYTEGAGKAPGALQARLGRLFITSGEEESATPTGQAGGAREQRARELPSIDLRAHSFVLDGRALGALALQARHHDASDAEPAAWVIRQLALTLPAAQFSAHGEWRGGDSREAPGSTQLDLQMETEDAGKLLDQLGFSGLLAQGKGSITGQIHWRGSPTSPDIASLGGRLELAMKSGRFLKTEPGVGRLLSVLSLQALPRRLTLDFRDLFSSGFAFDSVSSRVELHDGQARTDDFRMEGVNAAVQIAGTVSLVEQTEHLRVTIAPELDAGTAALGAALINPVLGAGAFIAQLALKGPLSAAATRSYEMTGTWADPHFAPVEPSKEDAKAPLSQQPEAGD